MNWEGIIKQKTTKLKDLKISQSIHTAKKYESILWRKYQQCGWIITWYGAYGIIYAETLPIWTEVDGDSTSEGRLYDF